MALLVVGLLRLAPEHFGREVSSPVSGKATERSGGRLPTEAFAVPASQGQAWARLFAPQPLRAGDSAKIVVRVTGSGPLRAWATGPGGARVASVPPPSAHLTSTFQRPGDEFGTYFVFPSTGSWTVSFERPGLVAAWQLTVVSA